MESNPSSRPTRPARPLPATIGRYRVIDRLGKGAMGIVYKAQDDVMERLVAVKVMMGDLQDDPETSARFYREAHAAGQLVHRNIITIFDMGDDDGRPYIVMELLEGRTLNEYLKRPEGVVLEEKIALMRQVCDGLQLAHSKNIYHRDIKPGNLLIRDDGTLKIVDFGIARLATSSMTVTGLIVGTPDYMSPEQACGREVDGRSDIFSAGAVFYYMLTGRKPFAGADLPAVLTKVQQEDPLPLRDTEATPALAAIVMKALAKSPTARYQNFGEMMTDLGRLARELAAENRRGGERARAQLAAIDVLAADRRKLSQALGVGVAAGDVEQFQEHVRRQYPTLGDWLDSGEEPLSRAAVLTLLDEVTAIHSLLEDEVGLQQRCSSELELGAAAANAGDLTDALDHFTAALKAVPASRRARDEQDRTRHLLSIEQAGIDRARALVAEAQNAANRADWKTVITLAEEAMAADRRNRDAASLRDRGVEMQASEAGRRQAQAVQLLERAEKLLRKGRYQEAEQSLAEARTLNPESPAIPALEQQIRTARLEAEQATERERQAAEAIAAARSMFQKGARAEALSDLQAFLERDPQASSVAGELAKLTAEGDRLAAAERRQAEAHEHAKSAEAALQADDPDRAMALARQALALHPGDPLARKTQDLAAARLRERALVQERTDAAARELEKARGLLARVKYDAARKAVRSAISLNPADAAAAAFLRHIDEQEKAALETEKRETVARQRTKAALPVLTKARAAEAQQDFVRATWLAESALALDFDCVEARQIIERVGAKISAEPALADETVKLADGGATSPDAEDTVTFSQTASLWRRVVDTIKTWTGGGVSAASSSGQPGAPRVK